MPWWLWRWVPWSALTWALSSALPWVLTPPDGRGRPPMMAVGRDLRRRLVVEPRGETLDELAAVAGTGDVRALEALLRGIRPAVLRRCCALLPCRDDAEEACQDAMLQVARKIDTFDGDSAFTTWLHPIVTDCVRQTYRSLKRRQAEVTAPAPDPWRTSVTAGARIDLLEAVERLERSMPAAVEPFLLRDLADLDHAEISRRLGLPVPALRQRIAEARRFVRQHLDRVRLGTPDGPGFP